MYKVGGLFSGVGGIELGFKNQGFDIRWANDNDIHCSKTYEMNHKHKYILLQELYCFELIELFYVSNSRHEI